jgi:hypothetical protein
MDSYTRSRLQIYFWPILLIIGLFKWAYSKYAPKQKTANAAEQE